MNTCITFFLVFFYLKMFPLDMFSMSTFTGQFTVIEMNNTLSTKRKENNLSQSFIKYRTELPIIIVMNKIHFICVKIALFSYMYTIL